MNTTNTCLVRRLPFALSLLLALVAVPLSQAAPASAGFTLTTSRSTLTLPPLAGLGSENSLRQAGRIAEIALGEALADCAALAPEEAAFAKDVEAYREDDRATKIRVDGLEAEHERRVEVHNADAMQQRALAQASNSLPAEKRNPATVSRGTAWAQEIGRRLVGLEAEARANSELRSREAARLNETYDRLIARQDALRAKEGLAYRQLKLCADYAQGVDRMLQAKHNATGLDFVKGEALVTAKEQLKELSSRGWDTP
jgi:hypothetical protein